MLFNSWQFIFLFLPISVLMFFQMGRLGGQKAATIWLIAVSLFFYGWWNPAYLSLLIFSILFNYLMEYTLKVMVYRQYFRSVLYGFLVSLLIFLLAVLCQSGVPTESSRWIYEIYQIKSSIANSIKVPKLVLVSGSNTHFGISCKIISTETGVPCVNGGTHMGLGTAYILRQARLWLKPGDLVLLPLEYEFYQDQGLPNYLMIDYMFARDTQYLLSLDLVSKLRFLFGISLNRLQQGFVGRLYPPQPLTTGYQSKTVNKYGDETINQKANMTEKQYHILNNSKPIEIETSQTSRYALNEINDFIIWCKEKNIKPRITWPNTLNFEVYKENVKQEFFQKIEQYYNDMKISVLGKPEDFMYNKAMFYDTSYHLNDIGVRYRTQQIIELLRPDLERIKQVIN
jgi:hypothetical protein